MNGYSRYPREGFLECPECGRWAIPENWRETSAQGIKMCLACFTVDWSEEAALVITEVPVTVVGGWSAPSSYSINRDAIRFADLADKLNFESTDDDPK